MACALHDEPKRIVVNAFYYAQAHGAFLVDDGEVVEPQLVAELTLLSLATWIAGNRLQGASRFAGT